MLEPVCQRGQWMSFWQESISLGLPCIQPAELWSLCVFPGLLWGYRVSHGVPQAGTPCLRLEAQQQTEPVDRRKLFMLLLHPTTSTRWDVSSSSDTPLQYMVAGREHQLTQWLLDVISALGENATFTRFPGLIHFSLFFRFESVKQLEMPWMDSEIQGIVYSVPWSQLMTD